LSRLCVAERRHGVAAAERRLLRPLCGRRPRSLRAVSLRSEVRVKRSAVQRLLTRPNTSGCLF